MKKIIKKLHRRAQRSNHTDVYQMFVSFELIFADSKTMKSLK